MASNIPPAAPGTALSPALTAIARRRGRTTLSNSVVADLESLIHRGALSNGERLPTEFELSDAFGVSRTVIRDAMRTLAARGLVEVRQGHGTIVSTPSSDAFSDALVTLMMRSGASMGEVVLARAMLETQIAPLAARSGTDEDWSAMDGQLARLAAAVEQRDWNAAHAEHLGFHQRIVTAIHSPALELILAPLQECVMLTSLPPTTDDPAIYEVETHPPILAALRARDEAALADAMDAHFGRMHAPVYEQFLASPFRAVAELDVYRALRR